MKKYIKNLKKHMRKFFANFLTFYKIDKATCYMFSFCLYRIDLQEYNTKDFKINIADNNYDVKFFLKKGFPIIKNIKINFYKASFKLNELVQNDIQNKVFLNLSKEADVKIPIIFNAFEGRKSSFRIGKIIIKEDTKTTMFFRQSIKNSLYLTVRETKETDYPKMQSKLFFAWLMSFVCLKRDIILLYEKESYKYEESASVLYELLIDSGYTNCYYILDDESNHNDKVKDKYKFNIISKYSLKHFIYFFKTKKFLGTETIGHAIDLRVANRLAIKKVNSEKNSFVFLQHGIMYMISLDSDLRADFNRGNKKMYKVVVSSKLEAKHFEEIGNFDSKDLYICGLPKYDKNILNKKADKIVIMPTWRRWEYNELRTNVENSKYYKMINRMVSAIPKEYSSKIVVLPHPLFINFINDTNLEIKKYIPKDFIYNDILENTKLLITDYSSIAYDAFYRGSNVIFYWEEKDECLIHYGSKAKLMLNNKNAFGDVADNSNELSKIIRENYINKQNPQYQKKYKKIVEFDDNNNANRLINFLVEDGFLRRRK